jgi:hypothetical protein
LFISSIPLYVAIWLTVKIKRNSWKFLNKIIKIKTAYLFILQESEWEKVVAIKNDSKTL